MKYFYKFVNGKRYYLMKHPVQTILGNTPSKSNCYRFANNIMYKTSALKKYEESFIWQCGVYRDLNIDVPFEFYINVFYPSKRSDLDNSLKVVLDSLQRVKGIKNDTTKTNPHRCYCRQTRRGA